MINVLSKKIYLFQSTICVFLKGRKDKRELAIGRSVRITSGLSSSGQVYDALYDFQ